MTSELDQPTTHRQTDQHPDYITGTCTSCGKEDELIFHDTKRCDTCDDDYCCCRICDTDIHRDNTCRHVYQNRYFEWSGAGTGYADSYSNEALFKLFDLMPDRFAPDLRLAIESGRFHTWFVGPMIGGGGTLELHGMPGRGFNKRRSSVQYWGNWMIKIGESEHAVDTADAYRWLASLYNTDTFEANKMTLSLIDEWLEHKQAA